MKRNSDGHQFHHNINKTYLNWTKMCTHWWVHVI